MQKFAWVCEVRGLVYAHRTDAPSGCGSYMAVYFDTFKTLAVKQDGKWKLIDKIYPLTFPGGCYNMAKDYGV